MAPKCGNSGAEARTWAKDGMTRALREMDSASPVAVLTALHDALSADGPAVLPRRAAPPPDSGRRAAPPLPSTVSQNIALVVETSGSTGVPKRVALSRDALLAGAAASESALGGGGQWLLALPVHYIAGAQLLVRSIAAGTDPLILPGGHFDPGAFAALADTMTADARFTSLVPAQLSRLLDAASDDDRILAALRRFDRILIGGQSMPAGLRERATDTGLRFTRTYGSSETCGGCVYDGVPIGTARARIVDGSLELAGPMLAEGYLDDSLRTEESFYANSGIRWYRTGDLGEISEGVVRVIGRSDSVIISGGEKVLLDAVENLVKAVTGFEEAVVVAAGSVRWGQVPVVVVESGGSDVGASGPEADTPGGVSASLAEPAASASLAALREHVARALGRAAAPDRIVQVPRMPRLPTGKPDRLALAAAVALDDGQRGARRGTRGGQAACSSGAR